MASASLLRLMDLNMQEMYREMARWTPGGTGRARTTIRRGRTCLCEPLAALKQLGVNFQDRVAGLSDIHLVPLTQGDEWVDR